MGLSETGDRTTLIEQRTKTGGRKWVGESSDTSGSTMLGAAMYDECNSDTLNPAVAGHAFGLAHLCEYFSERSPHPMLAVEGETCIVRHVNEAFLKLAGVKREAMIGQPFAVAVPEQVANGCSALLDRVYRTGTHEHLAEQHHGDTAAPVYWSYAVWAILGLDEQPVGVMIQVTDSTEIALFHEQAAAMNASLLLSSIRQQELTEEAEALNARLEDVIKEKEYFIAVLSHELRTPLTPILIAAHMLEKDPRLEPDAREMMRMVRRNITLEARLIDDLLDMTRMERGKLNLQLAPVDVREVMRRAVEISNVDLEMGKLSLEVDVCDTPVMMHADAGRLQQVFSNLLRNSVKFTPAGGHVRIRCRRNGDSCVVEVRDDGAGMDAEFLPRAFSAFEQGDKSLTRKAGLGLGLAICKTIVTLHGGTINAQSEGKGRGATFTVNLPVLESVTEIPPEPEAPPVKTHAGKFQRILLVEDHADTAELLRMLLEDDGYSVDWAHDIDGALRLAEANQFDLLLSDLGLPDGSGVDLMRTLRERGSTVPGIVLSGYGQEKDVDQSRAAGFATHLVKPFSQKKLHDAIVALVG
ncbi:MAG: response regulator [Burkholderiales bacterium]|nr:response regulator [Phycisphaerae bacterium]